MDYSKIYQEWCENSYFDETTRQELIALQGNDTEIKERFYKNLSFGTGGLRGIIGAGTNRMNAYTVRKASQGLANFILKEKGENKGVAIAYDSRRMSVEFSEEAALCLCANGIKTYRFESLRPTPELSFAVRELGCIAGIVVTASHNPAEYNGYKVYWEDGAQITAPKDEQIIAEVNSITDFQTVKTMSREDAIKAGLYHTVGEKIDDRYIEELKKQVVYPQLLRDRANEITVVYTPLHGAGNRPVQRILRELGFTNVYVVPEQEAPDGNFPTVSYPNPEDANAFTLALALAKEKHADLVMATDPDADRLGIYVYDKDSDNYIPFTGNMSGMLICEYLLSQRKELGLLSDKGVLVKTIVSTKMADKVAESYGLRLIEVLTGFKYIGEQIKLFEQQKNAVYEFGFEESYGCLVGTHARDKDAVVAVMSLCEAAVYYYTKGMTLWDQMKAIYKKYGYFREGLETITLKGMDGVQKIQDIMKSFRELPPDQIGKYKVLAVRDYQNDTILHMGDKSITGTGLPKSDVVYFDLEQDAWVCIRPSGTEPKIKFYIAVKGDSFADAEEKMTQLKKALMALVK